MTAPYTVRKFAAHMSLLHLSTKSEKNKTARGREAKVEGGRDMASADDIEWSDERVSGATAHVLVAAAVWHAFCRARCPMHVSACRVPETSFGAVVWGKPGGLAEPRSGVRPLEHGAP